MKHLLFCWVIVLLLSYFPTTTTSQYITDIKCTKDTECNKGDCVDYNNGRFCQCDDLYYEKTINGSSIACIQPIGKITPGGVISFVVVYIISMFTFLIIHIATIASLSLSDRKRTKKIESWQFDARVTLICLACVCILSIIYSNLLLQYSLGHMTNITFIIIADLSKVFYFEAGTAIVFYWMLAVQATPARAQDLVKYPVLAITFFIYMIWWAITSFFTSKSAEFGIYYFRLIFALLVLISITIGLIYYGRQILYILAPQAKSSKELAEKVAFFLYSGAFILICLIILYILIGVVNEMNTVTGYIASSLWSLMILEWMVHSIFLVIFSGGSFRRIAHGIMWVIKNRKGKSPMEIDLVKGDSNTPSTKNGSANGSGSRSANGSADEFDKRSLDRSAVELSDRSLTGSVEGISMSV